MDAPRISGSLTLHHKISGNLSGTGKISGTIQIQPTPGIEPYTGEYEFTPTEDLQTVPIQGKYATQNIIVNPIPSNYGRIVLQRHV